MESVKPSVVQTLANTASQVETIYNLYPSPVIGQDSSIHNRIRPVNESPTDKLVIDEEDM